MSDRTQFNMHDAKTNLSRLVERVEAGEEIVIARNGKPVAKLVPVDSGAPGKRPLGLMRGQIWVADDFDETPQEVIDSFYNSKIFPDEPDLP